MLGILAPNKLFLNSISVFTVYTELETLPSFLGETNFLAETLYHKGLVPHFSFLTLQTVRNI